MNLKTLAGGAALAALSLSIVPPAIAQEVTAAVRGYVQADDGAPIADATVRVTHVPTSTVAEVRTNAEGAFYVPGLRVGGPYHVEASSPGTVPDVRQYPALGLGDVAEVNLFLNPEGAAEEGIVVTATRREIETNGPTTRVSAVDIEQLPSIGRDPKDIFRLDPFVTIEPSNSDAIVVAGQNSRFNLISVDGVRQNDDFGLNNNGYPTQRSPVSLDAIEAISVRTAPYSVRYNGFTGGNINLVTRSGTNDFSGTIFYDYTDDQLGSGVIATPLQPDGRRNLIELHTPFETRTWGASLGGPIIKDRLFFFLSYEDYLNEAEALAGPAGSGRSVQVSGVTQAQLTAIQDALDSQYEFAFDAENSLLGPTIFPDVDEKVLGRVDWNITDDHRASFTYQSTVGSRPVEGIRSTSTLLSLRSNAYELGDDLGTQTFQIQSRWTDAFSTELIASFKTVDRTQQPIAGNPPSAIGATVGDDPNMLGQFEIVTQGAPRTTVLAGPDRSRHANTLLTETFNVIARAEYLLGDHRLLGGYELTDITAENLFAQDAEGRFDFNNLANFQAGIIDRLRYRQAVRDVNGDGVLNKLDFLVDWGYKTNSFYAEDSWRLTDDLTLLLGVRYDYYQSDDAPAVNNIVRFDGRTFAGRYGFDNSANLDGLDILLPRFGFEWRPGDWEVSGGVGLFSGGSPNVWISNNYSNDGQTSVLVDCNRASSNATCSQAVAQANLSLSANPTIGFDIPVAIQDLANTQAPLLVESVNALDPDFEPVSTWRANLSLQREFGDENPWRIGATAMYSWVENALNYVDARGCLVPASGVVDVHNCQPVGVGPDGRPLYNPNAARGGISNTDLILINTDEGHTLALAAFGGWSITEGPWRGSSFDLSYTYIDAKEVSPLTSSVAFSNYTGVATSDVNDPGLATSNTEIEHSFKGRASFERNFFGDLATGLSIFAERRSGLPFSYTFNLTNANLMGDPLQPSNRQLLYVPSGPSDPIVLYGDATTQAALDDFINGSGLADYRGQIAERNDFRSRWVTRIDLRFSQELPGPLKNDRSEVFMDILNVLNLINPRWGMVEQVEFPFVRPIVNAAFVTPATNAACTNASGCWVYSGFGVPSTNLSNSDAPRRSLYQIKFGVRYRF